MRIQAKDIYLALGSNLGDRLANLEIAREELNLKMSIDKCSSIYETPPWGYLSQQAFLNQVFSATTILNPNKLLEFVKSIEQKMGRVKTFLNGPRLIDIDILLFGARIVKKNNLVIPHPRMLERGFVLLPLNEIAPDLLIPGTSLTVKDHLKKVDQQGIYKLESIA